MHTLHCYIYDFSKGPEVITYTAYKQSILKMRVEEHTKDAIT